jgi:transposase InsO family protein
MLKNLYYNIKEPSSFRGEEAIRRYSKKKKLSQKEIKHFLQQQQTYTLHKRLRKKFPRQPVIVSGLNQQFQADIAEFGAIKKYNKNYKYVLFIIDCFSKYAFAKPLKTKSALDVSKAFEKILLENPNKKPKKLQTDQDKAFLSRTFQNLLKKYNIKFFYSYSDLKAQIVERLIRTIKTKLYKYFTANNTFKFIDVLPEIINTYNKSYHRSIRMAPNKVTLQNQSDVWYTLYSPDKLTRRNRDLKLNDKVRISKYARQFKKGYLANFSKEIFLINKVYNTLPTTYSLKDKNNNIIIGKFYADELSKTI